MKLIASIATATALILAASAANSACIGTGALQSCYDNNGNNYTVTRMGNMTHMDGNNSNTGSTWSQDTTRIGDMSITNGTDADGNSWNSTTTHMGDMSITNGTDSDGNLFSRTCSSVGCY